MPRQILVRLFYLFLFCGAKLVCAAEEKTDGPVILFFGDSLTAGYGLDPDKAYPALIQEKLDEAGLLGEVVVGAVSGDTSAGGLRRINWMLRRPVDVFVLALGANDALRGVDLTDTEKNLQAIIDKVREKNRNVQIVIAGMMMPQNFGPEYSEQFNALYPRLAEANDAVLIPFLLEDVAGHAELNLADGIHPNPKGHTIVAENVWVVLEPLVRQP